MAARAWQALEIGTRLRGSQKLVLHVRGVVCDFSAQLTLTDSTQELM